MKPIPALQLLIAAFALAPSAPLLSQENAPRPEAAAFDQKLRRESPDSAPAAKVDTGYADVVEQILPSVVSIGTYSRVNPGGAPRISPEDLENLPPLFREFFRQSPRFDRPGPRGRRSPAPPRRPQQTGLGSGVIITKDGYILTNSHVVHRADELKVQVPGKGRDFTAKVVGTDPQTDVALIKIEAADLTPAVIGDSAKLRVGEVLLAVGSPLGLEQSVTHGIVSGLGRSGLGILGNPQAGQAGYENFIQTDAAINPGNSGGPLLNARGQVVGLNTAIETRSGMFSGISLAVPINMAIAVSRDLLDGGKVQRGFLGIEMDQVDASMADYLGLENTAGVIVNSIVEESPAAKAGFQEGDAIVSLNEQPVAGPAQLRLAVSSHRPGSEVKFRVIRRKPDAREPESVELTATLQPLPGSGAGTDPAAPESGRKEAEGTGDRIFPGVTMENLTTDLRRHFGIAEDVEGLVVTAIDLDSAAGEVLEAGDVILQINRRPVRNHEEAATARKESEGPAQLKILRNGRTRWLVAGQ